LADDKYGVPGAEAEYKPTTGPFAMLGEFEAEICVNPEALLPN
jgi:hypothetical protein